MTSPVLAYQAALEAGFVADEAQWQAVTVLEETHQSLARGEPRVPGVYLWGTVGRGKTWLMDAFQRSLGVPVIRQHFHHFMRWVHRRQFQLTGTADPLARLAAELVGEARVLCLDELFVNDIADAMLLGRLLTELFEQGVTLVTTSNQAPADLYADGFNRERFLPAIEAIERSTRVVHLEGEQDHRRHPGAPEPRYWVRGEAESSVLPAVFERLNHGRPASDEAISLGHRAIRVRARGDDTLWCDYDALCERPLSALDFIALCDRFRRIVLGEVPCLAGTPRAARIARGTEDAGQRVDAGDRELPPLSRQDDGVRRFIALVDECYDRGIPLYIEARVAMEELYPAGHLAFPFRRTLSRLREMQLARFGP